MLKLYVSPHYIHKIVQNEKKRDKKNTKKNLVLEFPACCLLVLTFYRIYTSTLGHCVSNFKKNEKKKKIEN